MTTAAGGMAGTTGLFENFLVKNFQFGCRKSVFNAFTLPKAGEMKRFGKILSGLDMTISTVFKIIGRSGQSALMSFFFCFPLFITFVTGDTIHRKMEILAD